MEVGTMKITWKIEDFSNIQNYASYAFSLGPYKWMVTAYPEAPGSPNCMSINLIVTDTLTLPPGWSQKAKYSLTLVNQFDNKISHPTEIEHEFKATRVLSPESLISHTDLYDPSKGYLVENTCIIKTELTIYGDAFVEEPKENSIEEMTSFFGSLQSVISTIRVVSSKEEAKEALAIIEDALNKDPADVNNPCRISRVRNAFDVLSLSDGCSFLTSEQKLELVSMKDNFMDLPKRAANAVNDINLFIEKEMVKKTLAHKLQRCLVEFDSLLAQIEETKKLRENFSSRLKEMFRLSKELKTELDVLVENWPEYEAKMKAAEEEEKIVSTEWSKMRLYFRLFFVEIASPT